MNNGSGLQDIISVQDPDLGVQSGRISKFLILFPIQPDRQPDYPNEVSCGNGNAKNTWCMEQ